MVKVKDVVLALDDLTGGRVVKGDISTEISRNDHPFVIRKSSGIKGKEVMEFPGLVYGNPEKKVNKIAVAMTLSEQDIELAASTGVDVIIAHHPIADGSSSGGVTLRNYLDLYDIAVMELHEAFHGLHPGISYLHGHKVHFSSIHYGGVEGNVLFAGRTLPEVKVLGDILDRLESFMDIQSEREILQFERKLRNISSAMTETSIMTRGLIVHGMRESAVNEILHIFPHTGFSIEDLRQAKIQFPNTDTLVISISRVRLDSEFIQEAIHLGLQVVIGNCHVLEIFENGLPLAYALDTLLPEVEVIVHRERVYSYPLREIGNAKLQQYGKEMSQNYLVNKKKVLQQI